MMANDFDVITYGNGAFLYDVFNGVAAVFGNSSYGAAMATCMTAASIGIMISAVLQGRMVNLLWMLQAIFLYMLLVVPKVSVNIVDKTEIDVAYVIGSGSVVRRVDNIPIGMAVVSSSVSTFSSWTTKTFETVFSLPNGMRYSQHGPLFGQSLVQDMLAYRPNNANLTNSLQSFWQNCVFYDIALGFYTFDELSTQSDILSFLKTRTAMTRGFYNEAGGAKTFVDCRTGATTLEQDLLVEQQDFKSRSGNKANVTMKSTDAMASAGWTAMPVAFAYLSNVSTTASKLLIQSAMMNSMDTGLSSMAGNVDADAAIQGYALARAERERETTFGVMGAMAAEMLPLLKNLMEGLMYAVFPLVGLAILFPNGWRAFGYYARMLIWIGLWPVAFALLHYAMTYFGSFAVQKAAAHYDLLGTFSESKYNMYSQMGIMDVMKKYEAIAGYMMTMIPMVTYVMVAQGGAMMAGMLGRVMDGYAKPAESAAMEASAGNFSVGNTNFDNQRAFQHMSAPSQIAGYIQTSDGGFTTTTSQYGSVYNQNVSTLGMSVSSQKSFEQATSRAVEQAIAHESTTSANLATARASAISDAFREVRGGAETTTTGINTQETNQNVLNQMVDTVRSSAERFANSQGWKSEESKAFVNDTVKSFSAGGTLGVTVAGTGISAGGTVQESNRNSEGAANSNTKAAARMQEYLQSDQAREALSKLHTIVSNTQTGHNNTSTHSTENQHNISFETAQRAESTHAEAVKQLSAARLVRSQAESTGFTVNVNEIPAVIEHLKQVAPQDWRQGVFEYEKNLDTNEAKVTDEAIQGYVSQRIQQQIDFNKESSLINQQGQQAVENLGDVPLKNSIPQENSLAKKAEAMAKVREGEQAVETNALNDKLIQNQDFVTQDVNSGSVRVGNAAANSGNEGTYLIPPQKSEK